MSADFRSDTPTLLLGPDGRGPRAASISEDERRILHSAYDQKRAADAAFALVLRALLDHYGADALIDPCTGALSYAAVQPVSD